MGPWLQYHLQQNEITKLTTGDSEIIMLLPETISVADVI